MSFAHCKARSCNFNQRR